VALLVRCLIFIFAASFLAQGQDKVVVADAFVHATTGVVLARVERAHSPRVFPSEFSGDNLFSLFTPGSFPCGWYFGEPSTGVLYQLRIQGNVEEFSTQGKMKRLEFGVESGFKPEDPVARASVERIPDRDATLTLALRRFSASFAEVTSAARDLTVQIQTGKIHLVRLPSVRKIRYVLRHPRGVYYVVDHKEPNPAIHRTDPTWRSMEVIRSSHGSTMLMTVVRVERAQEVKARVRHPSVYP
jgi:hypothetical protein